jgi:dihydrofolate synthase/folylpolyglutamate synthase
MFDPEACLNSLEPIGWKLGLERMELLSDELGRPQDSFEPIHVVGTNGKSSVARMSAALIEAHGRKSGCSLSPHISRWSERVLISGTEVPAADFAAAVERAVEAADRVNGNLEEGEVVTQFELATAAAFLAMADAGVEVAAIEAGLGGRLDATNTIRSKVTVLTSIGLDHTEWLGETELEIAAEKIAVLRPGTTLVIGDLAPEVERFAVDRAAELGCEVKKAGEGAETFELAVPAKYQRGNFAVAVLAAETILGGIDHENAKAVAGSIVVPGRLEKVGEDPPVYVDVAHNRPGAAALADSVPGIADGRPVIAVIGVLSDKDAPGMLAELAAVIDTAILTGLPEDALRDSGRPGARAFPVDELETFADGLGMTSMAEPDPHLALSRAISEAKFRGGLVLVAGSHFLLSGLRAD